MSFDYLKKNLFFDDEEKFIRLCESIEDVIRENDKGDGRYSDLEIMQAIDYVAFNFFRDDWEEFQKNKSPRELNLRETFDSKGKKLIN